MKIKFLIIPIILSLLIIQVTAQESEFYQQHQLDINTATLEQISQLPVSDSIAKRIYDYVIYRGYFKSIYDLRQIEGIDQKLFELIKPLIRIEPFTPRTSIQEKIEQIYFRLDRWSSGEGVNDAFIDLWVEKALDPMNVNNARYDQLVNLQNVSPIDAAAIVRYRKDVHWLRDERDLRRTPGLSNYAYRTARYFLDYKDSELSGVHGSILTRLDNTPFMASEGEQSTEAGLSAISGGYRSGYNMLPNLYSKMRLSVGQDIKMGLSYTRNLNEPTHYYGNSGSGIPEAKFYVGLENQHFGDFELRKLYAGNYSVTIGQGVIMENTDFFMPRKSGYGFRKRFTGLSGDNSRTREFTLRGVAAEAGFKNFSALGFFSYDTRDAIINRHDYSDSTGAAFNQLIILDQRFNYALDDTVRGSNNLDLSWLNSVTEMTYGWHFKYDFFPGTYLGATYYESLYDRPIDPDPYEIVGKDYAGRENWDRRQVTADSEIKQSYGGAVSRGQSAIWADALSFRRVYGFDFQTVLGNLVLQGEYGELEKTGQFYKIGDDPKAMVLSAYMQFPTMNILALYRNYDVGFDNPYQRSFSNNHRFKGTIYEDYYYLQSVLYGQLYENSAQPQAEEGFYLDSYYQLHRKFTGRLQYDNFVRKSDGAKNYRLVGTINYRPVFPLTFQMRQKWQAREEQNDLTSGLHYKNLEFRGRMRMRLSNYNNLDLLYTSSKLIVHPRPRVFGDIVLDGEAMAANFVHNFNRSLKFSGMLAYYKGFLWNFEDTQFVVMDSPRGALRYWLSLYMRLDHHLSVRMKYTGEQHKPVSNVSFDAWQSTLDENPDKRFSADWNRNTGSIYYFELNYNF